MSLYQGFCEQYRLCDANIHRSNRSNLELTHAIVGCQRYAVDAVCKLLPWSIHYGHSSRKEIPFVVIQREQIYCMKEFLVDSRIFEVLRGASQGVGCAPQHTDWRLSLCLKRKNNNLRLHSLRVYSLLSVCPVCICNLSFALRCGHIILSNMLDQQLLDKFTHSTFSLGI